jgi:hypothetical protein
VTGLPRVASAEVPIATLVASYEALRRAALGRRGPDEGPSLGFAVLLRQGMVTWLRAWAMCPQPAAPAPQTGQRPDLPPLVHLELAQVWVHMALAHWETVWT